MYPVPADPLPQDKATMRAKFIRYGVMMLPDDPLHGDPANAIDGNMLADALDLINVPDTWDASLALTSVQGKRKRMIENNEADQDEYMVRPSRPTRSGPAPGDRGPAPGDRKRADSHPPSPPRCHPSVTRPLTFES